MRSFFFQRAVRGGGLAVMGWMDGWNGMVGVCKVGGGGTGSNSYAREIFFYFLCRRYVRLAVLIVFLSIYRLQMRCFMCVVEKRRGWVSVAFGWFVVCVFHRDGGLQAPLFVESWRGARWNRIRGGCWNLCVFSDGGEGEGEGEGKVSSFNHVGVLVESWGTRMWIEWRVRGHNVVVG